MLFQFEPGRTSSMLQVVRMEQELSRMLGREVDLIERSAVEKEPQLHSPQGAAL